MFLKVPIDFKLHFFLQKYNPQLPLKAQMRMSELMDFRQVDSKLAKQCRIKHPQDRFRLEFGRKFKIWQGKRSKKKSHLCRISPHKAQTPHLGRVPFPRFFFKVFPKDPENHLKVICHVIKLKEGTLVYRFLEFGVVLYLMGRGLCTLSTNIF